MEPMKQGADQNMQETPATLNQVETKPDAQTGATPMNDGELGKSTVMREAVQKSARQGLAASNGKNSKKKTFGFVLFIIGIIELIITLVVAAFLLTQAYGEMALYMVQVIWLVIQTGIFGGLVFMGIGKGLMLLQEMVNHARSQVR